MTALNVTHKTTGRVKGYLSPAPTGMQREIGLGKTWGGIGRLKSETFKVGIMKLNVIMLIQPSFKATYWASVYLMLLVHYIGSLILHMIK